jgi:peptidoglycan/LPS O-acetylase OafA/YrhL
VRGLLSFLKSVSLWLQATYTGSWAASAFTLYVAGLDSLRTLTVIAVLVCHVVRQRFAGARGQGRALPLRGVRTSAPSFYLPGLDGLRMRFARTRGQGRALPLRDAGTSAPSAYLPGLDGLRALAVIAVLVYHARPGWLPGGFLGVEVFFVVSGFIITRGLLGEWDEHGRIGLTSFWLRRARRLLPAVGLLLTGVLAYVAAFEPSEVARLRGDVLAALAYITNWHLILGEQSYFESFQRPSMLRHLWSLAVEEQFYIVWPLVLAFGLPVLKRWGLVVLIVAGIAASAVGMALLYDPAGDNSRVYFGTDTRAAALLAGALLAFALASVRISEAQRLLRVLPALGLTALALLASATLWLAEGMVFLYQGGFLAVSLTTGVLILVLTQRNGLSGVVGCGPLRWVGVRSYGIYLWHWPIYMLTWPREASPSQIGLQVVATFVIAAASYSLVEKPVREGALGRVWQRVRDWPAQSPRYRAAVGFSGAGAMAVFVSLFAVALLAKPPSVPPYYETGSIRLQSAVLAEDAGSIVHGPTLMGRVQTTISALTTRALTCTSDSLMPDGRLRGVESTQFASTCPQPVALFEDSRAAEIVHPEPPGFVTQPSPAVMAALFAQMEPVTPQPASDEAPPKVEETVAAATGGPQPAPPLPAEASQQLPAPPVGESKPLLSPPSVTAIGDSVMLGAAYALAGSIAGIDLDAAIGRQASDAIALLQQRADAGLLGEVVVVQIGNNGAFKAEEFDQVMTVIGPDRKAIFINVKVPRAWEESNNAVIANGVSRYPNAVLVDWAAAASSYDGLFNTDGIHLTAAGAAYYAELVVAAIGGR